MDGDRYENPEKLYFGRTLRPHCPTCVCPETNLCNRRTRRVSYPSPPRKETQRVVRRESAEFVADDVSDDDEQPMIRRGQDRVERRQPPPTTQERRKLEILERCFERFDFNEDDFLDPYELRSLFKSLGVLLSKEYCQGLLDSADRDGDGRLSFPEFLLLWRIAQQDDELADAIGELLSSFPGNEQDYLRRRNPEVRSRVPGEEGGPQVQLPPQRRGSAGQEPRAHGVGEEEDAEVLQSSGDRDGIESPSSLRSCYNEMVKEIEYMMLRKSSLRSNKNLQLWWNYLW